jgi:hypothetical protein
VCPDHLLQKLEEKESHFDYAKFFYTHKVWDLLPPHVLLWPAAAMVLFHMGVNPNP